ncbi:PAS domain-containing protein [Rubrobacter marinus]|uniref:PAS domain-containing protein n=1 Tax=Rubrobacter marinus TaxID=2653852 RepID=A0A6G8PW78_9ACTN|nr:LuxR C-terminal-related transcriptional regulator [Rubrobacter marinus]QIN78443.1 PAS domain-containing protein [Rubrobacter marinus]
MEKTLNARTEDRTETTVPLLAKEGHENGAGVLPPVVEGFVGARTMDAVFAVAPDHRILYWDSRMESLTGILAEEAVGMPFYEVLVGECEDGGSFSARAWAATRLGRDGQPIPGYDARIETRMGGGRWIGVSVLGLDTKAGTYLVHLVRDAQRAHDTLEMARGLLRLSPREETATAARPKHRDAPELTPRQREVLGMLADGKGVKEIRRELYLSQATVRNHVRSLLQALGAHSQLEALAKARKAGLLDE